MHAGSQFSKYFPTEEENTQGLLQLILAFIIYTTRLHYTPVELIRP